MAIVAHATEYGDVYQFTATEMDLDLNPPCKLTGLVSSKLDRICGDKVIS